MKNETFIADRHGILTRPTQKLCRYTESTKKFTWGEKAEDS
jgi:hypothetical protein